MSEAKHTAGPWVQFIDMGKCVAIMPAGRAGDICTFAQSPSDANAALMTAAPDMLSAMQDAEYALTNIAETFNYNDDDGPDKPCPFHELCGENMCRECGCIRDKRDACRAAISKAGGRP